MDESTRLAYQRSWLAEERTAMAWIRTATSLITFGFAIYSFFAVPSGAGHHLTQGHMGAQIFSAMLICIGLVALIGAALQRRHALRLMKLEYSGVPSYSTASIVGSLVALLGVAALVILVFHL